MKAENDEYKEKDMLHQMMIKVLEDYKQKAEMSKELATYFEPFSNIRIHEPNDISKLPQIKKDVISIKDALDDASGNDAATLRIERDKYKALYE